MRKSLLLAVLAVHCGGCLMDVGRVDNMSVIEFRVGLERLSVVEGKLLLPERVKVQIDSGLLDLALQGTTGAIDGIVGLFK